MRPERAGRQKIYLGTAELLGRIDTRGDHRHVVSNLPQALDQIREADLHSADMAEGARLHKYGDLLLLLGV